MNPRNSNASHTPLFASLRRSVRLASYANLAGAPPVDELPELAREARLSRRGLLAAGTAAAAGLATPASARSPWPFGRKPRIAIVGGGMAGLRAANLLTDVGLRPVIYEASERLGGRMWTAHDLLAEGQTTELGGEFIDSGHADMLELARAFELELIDVTAPSEQKLIPEAYYFDNQHYSEAQVIEAFQPVAASMQRDYNRTSDIVKRRSHSGFDRKLDRLNVIEYLDRTGADGFLRKLLDVGYTTEYGLNAEEQSCLNLLFLIGLDTKSGFEIFGESDERYKVLGGNQQITDRLAERVADQITPGHRLAAIRKRDKVYRLTFDVSGASKEIDADFVLLTLPFTLLRQVDIKAGLPKWKTRAIQELGYGTNAKLLIGFQKRVWREQGYSGNIFTDESFQSGWDNSRQQPVETGGFTMYSGGSPGIEVGQGTPESQAALHLPGLEKAFPTVTAFQNGNVARVHWPTEPFVQASYACYKPGQWTTLAGDEITPINRLFFAGEHCSYNYQGYMNGAAETGRRAAEAILGALRPGRL